MTAENDPAPSEGGPLGFLFRFKGRIGRGRFIGGLGVIVILAVCMLAAAAGFMDPRGGFGLFIPVTAALLILVAWIHSAIVVKRLRDAALPAWLWLVFGPGPFVLLLTAEYLQSFWWIAVLGCLALIVAPAFFASKTEPST